MIKRLCVLALLMLGGIQTHPVLADPYKAFTPKGGLDKTTVIPGAYADGSSATLSQIGQMADSSVQQTDANKPNGYVKPDGNGNITLPVSGDSSQSTVTASGGTVARSNSVRASDTNNLSDIISAYDGSDTFKSKVTAYYNSLGTNGIITLPCGANWPFYDTKTGYAWGPSGKGILFVDICGNTWRGAPGWATPAYDRGFGDNNNVLANYNGDILINRFNTTSSNGNGQLSLHISDMSTSAANYGGSIFADAPQLRVTYDMMQYGLDGVTPTRGSPVAGRFIVNNWTGQNWSVQAQALKQTCNTMVQGGSCWAGSFEANNKSGHTGLAFDLIHENDQESNGPENPAATWDPKQSHRFMEYYSAIALSPPSWSANTTYNLTSGGEPTLIDVVDSTGTERILRVKVAGTSGTTAPVLDMSTLSENSTIVDGTVTWEVGTTRANVVGVAVYINRDPAKSGGNASDMNSYNFGFSTGARFNNSVIDLSHAIMNDPRAVAMRMAPDQKISLCDSSGASKDSDLNRCTLQYASYMGDLVYTVGGKQVFDFNQNGNATFGGDVAYSGHLFLSAATKANILAITSPREGEIINDATDHVPVIYENGKWYPIQLGTALSN